MTERYGFSDLDARRWDDDAPIEGDREDVACAVGLLARVRYAWSGFVSVFAMTGSEARTGLIRREPWQKASRFLKAIEDMARGLLLMMALALSRQPQPSPKSTQKPAPKPSKRPDPLIPRDETCFPQTSLSVLLWLAAPESRGESRTVRKVLPASHPSRWRLSDRWHTIRGLVCRTDALLRILNHPEPFARRLALRLEGRNQSLAFPEYPSPPPPRLLRHTELLQEMKPGNPYRFILAPLWAHCADLWAARESPG